MSRLDARINELAARIAAEFVAIRSEMENIGSGNPTPVPARITNLTATPLSASEVELYYTPAAGATSHQYRVEGGDATAMPIDLVVDGLAEAPSIDFEVRGVNGSGPGVWSNVATATMPAVDPGVTPAPVLTPTSSGVNPPTWKTSLDNPSIGDVLRLQIDDNAEFASPSEETNVLDSDEAMLGDIAFAIVNGLPDGPTHTRMRIEPPGRPVSEWAYLPPDTIVSPAAPAAVRTFRKAANNDLGYGGGPSVMEDVTIAEDDTLFVTVHNQPNTDQPTSQLTGIVAVVLENGVSTGQTIELVKMADNNAGAGGAKQASLWRAYTSGVTQLDLVASVSGSTQSMILSATSVSGGDYVAGSFAGGSKNVGDQNPITLGGPYTVAEGGEVILLVNTQSNSIFLWSGAAAINELDNANGAQSLAVQTVTGSPTLAGHNAGGFGYRDIAWSAFAWEPTA